MEFDYEKLWEDPSFAVICSFFNKFSVALGIRPLSFPKLESMFAFDEKGRRRQTVLFLLEKSYFGRRNNLTLWNQSIPLQHNVDVFVVYFLVSHQLIDIHVQLLRKIGFKAVQHKHWERTLLRYCAIDPTLASEYFQLERFGYVHTSLSTKLTILKALCECQFDFNVKFKEQVSTQPGPALRVLPIGTDKNGLAYWYQLDGEHTLRLYSDEQDDASGATWTIKAKNRDELAQLIERLKSGAETDSTHAKVTEVLNELCTTSSDDSSNLIDVAATASSSSFDVTASTEEVVQKMSPSCSTSEPQPLGDLNLAGKPDFDGLNTQNREVDDSKPERPEIVLSKDNDTSVSNTSTISDSGGDTALIVPEKAENDSKKKEAAGDASGELHESVDLNSAPVGPVVKPVVDTQLAPTLPEKEAIVKPEAPEPDDYDKATTTDDKLMLDDVAVNSFEKTPSPKGHLEVSKEIKQETEQQVTGGEENVELNAKAKDEEVVKEETQGQGQGQKCQDKGQGQEGLGQQQAAPPVLIVSVSENDDDDKIQLPSTSVPTTLSLAAPGRKGRCIDAFDGSQPLSLPAVKRRPGRPRKIAGADAPSSLDQNQSNPPQENQDPENEAAAAEEVPPKEAPLSAENAGDGATNTGTVAPVIPEERRILPPRRTRAKQLFGAAAAALASSNRGETGSSDSRSRSAASGGGADSEGGAESSAAEKASDESSADDELRTSDDSEDSDFIPLSILRTRTQGRKLRTNLSPRKSNKKKLDETSTDDDDSEEEVTKKVRKPLDFDSYCQKCSLGKNPELLLLCDKCDHAWHTWCLRPPLWFVPNDDWYCPRCNQVVLIENLSVALASLDEALKLKEEEQKMLKRKQERLEHELNFAGISVNNIIKTPEPMKTTRAAAENARQCFDSLFEAETEEESEEDMLENDNEEEANNEDENAEQKDVAERSKANNKKRSKAPPQTRRPRRQREVVYEGSMDLLEPAEPLAKSRAKRRHKDIDYSFKEFDDLIQEAVDENVEFKSDYRPPPCRPSGVGRGKDMANILEATRNREREMMKERNSSITSEPPAEPGAENSSANEPSSAAETSPTKLANTEERDGADEEQHPEDPKPSSDDEAVKGNARLAQLPLSSAKTKKQHKHKKLTDLDLDNMTESEESEEYKGSSDDDEEQRDSSDTDSDWEEEVMPSRRSTRLRSGGRTQSDDDFVVSDSENTDSDFDNSKRKTSKNRRSSTAKRSRKHRYESDDSDDSTVKRNSKRRRKSYSDESEEEESDPDFCPSSARRVKRKASSGGGRSKKRSKKVDKKSKNAGRRSEDELSEEDRFCYTAGGRRLRARKAQVNYRALENPKLSGDESEQEGDAENLAAAKRNGGFSKAAFARKAGDESPDDDMKSGEMSASSGSSESVDGGDEIKETADDTLKEDADVACCSTSKAPPPTKAIRRAPKARIQSSSEEEDEKMPTTAAEEVTTVSTAVSQALPSMATTAGLMSTPVTSTVIKHQSAAAVTLSVSASSSRSTSLPQPQLSNTCTPVPPQPQLSSIPTPVISATQPSPIRPNPAAPPSVITQYPLTNALPDVPHNSDQQTQAPSTGFRAYRAPQGSDYAPPPPLVTIGQQHSGAGFQSPMRLSQPVVGMPVGYFPPLPRGPIPYPPTNGAPHFPPFVGAQMYPPAAANYPLHPGLPLPTQVPPYSYGSGAPTTLQNMNPFIAPADALTGVMYPPQVYGSPGPELQTLQPMSISRSASSGTGTEGSLTDLLSYAIRDGN